MWNRGRGIWDEGTWDGGISDGGWEMGEWRDGGWGNMRREGGRGNQGERGTQPCLYILSKNPLRPSYADP